MIYIKRVGFFCIVLHLLLTITLNAQGNLTDKRITLKMDDKPLYTVFSLLMNKYDIAIGFEESILDRQHYYYDFSPNVATKEILPSYKGRKEVLPGISRSSKADILPKHFTLDFKNAPLTVVMDSIVKQMEHYDWEMVEGVVNIYPKKGRDPRLEKLLNLEIKTFVVGTGAEMRDIQARITMFMPEFQEFLKKNGLEASSIASYGPSDRRKIPEGMYHSNLTLRELLNNVTKFKRGGWTLSIKKYSEDSDIDFVELMI